MSPIFFPLRPIRVFKNRFLNLFKGDIHLAPGLKRAKEGLKAGVAVQDGRPHSSLVSGQTCGIDCAWRLESNTTIPLWWWDSADVMRSENGQDRVAERRVLNVV